MSARRVSFSERISYSDDASTTTESTEEELYRDDGSFASSDGDEDNGLGDEKDADAQCVVKDEESIEDVLAEVTKMCKDNSSEVQVSDPYDDAPKTEKEDSDGDDSEEVFSRSSYLSVEDEPPLVFRDVGVTQRPSEYLGGYAADASDIHRVKLRKSWVAPSADDEEQSERHEFEAWKRERAKAVAEKKKAKAITGKQKQGPVETQAMVKSENNLIIDTTEPNQERISNEGKPPPEDEKIVDGDKPGKETHAVIGSEEQKEVETSLPITSKTSTKKPKSALKKLKSANDEDKNYEEAKTKKRKSKQPNIRDQEVEAHEKEILELKERIASLQRQLDVAEVRTISQLADLEEETTKRMREYRAKADEIVRKQRAKNEKKALKEKAMKSQDLIDQLRKSNQKMRAESSKMQVAIAKLRESNQSLEEKNSVHRGYASEFLSFQKIEVSIAEAMNQSLSKDIPKYEKLIRNMEEGVLDRLKSGHVERNAKELYEDCIQTMVDMLDANCTDSTLLDKVALLMEDEEDRPAQQDASSYTGTRRSLIRKPEGKQSSLKAALGNSTHKRPSRSGSLKEDSQASAAKAVRRSKSITAKISKEVQQSTADENRSGMGGSLRGARTNRKSNSKPVSDSDDSSTCSVTSMPSVTSEAFSISDYAY